MRRTFGPFQMRMILLVAVHDEVVLIFPPNSLFRCVFDSNAIYSIKSREREGDGAV